MLVADEVRAVFSGAGLGEPPIPSLFERQLRKIGKWHYATNDALTTWAYRYRTHEAAAHRPDAPSSLVLAHAGHGVNSYAISYYLVLGRTRILLQLGWGGVYTDNVAAATRIRAVFEALQHQLPAIEQRTVHARIVELFHSDLYPRDGRSNPPAQELAVELEHLLAPSG